MRPSKNLIASAATAAIVSVIGLAYAETSEPVGNGDTAQMQTQTRNDTSTAPAGNMQPNDPPAGSAAVAPATMEPGSATGDSSGSAAMPAATGTSATRQGNTGAATDSTVNRAHNNGDYNASSNAGAATTNGTASGAAAPDTGAMPAERPAKPDRN